MDERERGRHDVGGMDQTLVNVTKFMNVTNCLYELQQ
jgi:hypothetical protein